MVQVCGVCAEDHAMQALFASRLFWTTRLVTLVGQVSPAIRLVSYGVEECGEPQFRYKKVPALGQECRKKSVANSSARG